MTENFQTPILFCFFNRLDATQKVFEQIKKCKPEKLYLHQDGARNVKEKEKIEEIRSYIISEIDWECKLNTIFQEENLGCNKSIIGAVRWVLKKEESAIILEDDCVPSSSFFDYCRECLEKYKDNDKIFHIAGWTDEKIENYYINNKYQYSYSFIGVMHCWGWATWKRAFVKYDENETTNFALTNVWKNLKNVSNNFLARMEYYYRYKYRSGTWDWFWSQTIVKNNGICITPAKNLISNIGLISSRDGSVVSRKIEHITEIDIPLKHVPVDRIKNDIILGNLFIIGGELIIWRLPFELLRWIVKRMRK